MKLQSFRVTKFRSVIDSGWITTDDVTALIGTNESGKTNLLLPLWKLNPASEGELDPVSDYPRAEYSNYKSLPDDAAKPKFITALFELEQSEVDELIRLTGAPAEFLRRVKVSRTWDGSYSVGYPDHPKRKTVPSERIKVVVSEALAYMVSATTSLANDVPLKETAQIEIGRLRDALDNAPSELGLDQFRPLKESFSVVGDAPKKSIIRPRVEQLEEELAKFEAELSQPLPNAVADARKYVLTRLPKFVYYSNYGNLDSEIYLPHVIKNLARTDLGAKEQARARTLKVLFSFVGLEPEEILQLGIEVSKNPNEPTEEEIQLSSEQKREREILLQSAGTKLTKSFREWWKQGDYNFRFQADGNHFRIWVSDDKRPEPVELEGRSTGLQWFLSFYLIFLVESEESHAGAVLLLDEPGLSLHPIAQEALSKFFDNLSTKNQIVYTTHSPFLIDSDRLERVKAVYVDIHGQSVVSGDLRASATINAKAESIYPVHAALGLTVSQTLFLGCEPVIVEGTSDQIILSLLKTYMVRKGLAKPKAELLFVPAGGVSGISAVVSILTGKDEKLPFVLVDSDKPGLEKYKNLCGNVYKAEPKKVLSAEWMTGIANTELEDLIPPELYAEAAGRYFRTLGYLGEDEFKDLVKDGPLVPQMEEFAKKNGITLEKPGWKVDLAKQAKARFSRVPNLFDSYPNYIEIWKKLFAMFE